MSSVFTKIINGEIPSYKIFENDLVIVILAKDQIQPGHTLVIPKIEIDNFFDVPEPYYSEVFKTAKNIAKALKAYTNCYRVGSMIDGREISHFHLHLIPLKINDKLSFDGAKTLSQSEMSSLLEGISKHL